MGFFDNYTDAGGGNWVGKDEKAELIKEATPLKVLSVRKGESKFGLRYVVNVELDGEERSLSFTAESVESRDRLLDAMTGYLEEAEDTPDFEAPVVKLTKVGQSILIEEA